MNTGFDIAFIVSVMVCGMLGCSCFGYMLGRMDGRKEERERK